MMNPQPTEKTDLESGTSGGPLYPTMLESPELRWSFIRKVYSILAIQLLLTVAIGAVVVFVHPITTFMTTTRAGLALNIVLLITPLITLLPLYYYHQRHPINYLLLAIFTISLAFGIGPTCAHSKGKLVLEAAILTAVVVVSLTLFTFWAAKKGYDFNFLGPFLFSALMVLVAFSLIQILYPFGKFSKAIFGCLSALVFCGYIVYDTDNLIKRYTYDDYIHYWKKINRVRSFYIIEYG